MKRYLYNYQTVVRFSQPVRRHAVLLRALPMMGGYVGVEEEHLLISPNLHLMRGTDSLGNRIAYGCWHEAHDCLAYVSTGVVSMDDYRMPLDEIPLMVYREPTSLTFLTDEEVEKSGLWKDDLCPRPTHSLSSIYDTAKSVCHLVYEKMTYTPSVTTAETKASDVLATCQGVCQDYAHLMLALCRMVGIAARYVCGIMEGEGETHAWVEICDGKRWYGFDPTHDAEIKQGYLKLAHGRDASDCPVSRGIYMGNACQETEVHVLLKEI